MVVKTYWSWSRLWRRSERGRRRHAAHGVIDEVGSLLGTSRVADTCSTNAGIPSVAARSEVVGRVGDARAEATLELALNAAVGLGVAGLTVAREGATITRILAGTNRIVVAHLAQRVILRAADNVAGAAGVRTPRGIVMANCVRIGTKWLIIQTYVREWLSGWKGLLGFREERCGKGKCDFEIHTTNTPTEE